MSMKNVKISVITVCYNSSSTIRKTIESILHQSYDNIEYIIVDGASKDNTVDIIREYEEAFGDKLHWLSEPDHGIYDAMNKGVALASGELIGILNSDDTYELNAVEEMAKAYLPKKYQVLYGYMNIISDGSITGTVRPDHSILPEEMICHPSCFVSANIYQKYGAFDLQYPSVADYDFMIRMSKISEVEFVPVEAVIANFYLGGMSSSDFAYMDLLKLKTNYGMISKSKYRYHQLIYKLMCIKRSLFKTRRSD